MRALLPLVFILPALSGARAEWLVSPAGDHRATFPPGNASGRPVKPGDSWPADNQFRWLVNRLRIPETIDGTPVAGRCVGMQINCGDGGEVWVNGQLQTRYDNDHPALALLAERAEPGAEVNVAVQVYGKVQGGDKFEEARWVIMDPKRALEPVILRIDAKRTNGKAPYGLIGLSQGGGMADYDDSTADKLRKANFKWFRMDNIFTPVMKTNSLGGFEYDWKDFDRRVDFISKIGAYPILCVSYMPQVLDAVPNNERQSAPRDYSAWEELCYRAAKRALDRGKRVPYWEVWNEVNAGWLKPGPADAGSPEFQRLYDKAAGRIETSHEVVRRFEAYCKLYRATARGILRADPRAKIGGPALASGPFENSQYGFCNHGEGFARGLMLWCRQEKLPLDFVSWHEYFQSADMIGREADAFRGYLKESPGLQKSVKSFMLTEWNEAWWPDRPQDHELGAAWCANCVIRAFIPHGIDRPCFFYVKQGDDSFRGDYAMLLKDNTPKASYNVAKMFNQLSGDWLEVKGGDDDVSCVAAWDARKNRLAVVMVNFRDRYSLGRKARVEIKRLPSGLLGGQWREYIVDATHANAWTDLRKAELEVNESGPIDSRDYVLNATLGANSVTLLELIRKD